MPLYTLQRLAQATGEKERTVRYYQQLGLLRQPGQVGPGAHYGEDDRLRLQLIRRLQSEGRSLAEIAEHFRTLDDDAIRDEVLSHSSALDYIQAVLGTTAPAAALPRVSAAVAAPSLAPAVARNRPSSGRPRKTERATVHASLPAPPNAGEPSVAATAVDPPTSWRWERFDVVPGIELHVQLPISAHRRRAITAYIERTRNELERMNS